MPGPYGPGQDYTLRDVAAGLIARGITDPQVLTQAVAIVARENGLHSPDQVGNTATLNQSEPPNVAAIGPFQFIYTGWSDGTNRAYGTYDRQQAANSLDYTLNYVVPLLQNKDFSPWTTPQLGMTSQQLAAQFASPSSPFFQTAQAAIATAGGARPAAQSVGLTSQPQAQQAMAPYDRRADLLERQSRGVTLGADAIAYLNSTGGQYQAPQQQAQSGPDPNAMGPNGRSYGQVLNQPYSSPEERAWFLGLQGKGLDADGNVVDLASGGGRAAPRIAPPDTGDGGLQGQQQPQQQTSPYIQGGGPYGNQTTLDNATAQMQMGQNYGYQQQAAQSAYNASPAVAGAYAAQQQPQQQQAGPMSQGDQANAQQGGAESQFAAMKHGGQARIGMPQWTEPDRNDNPWVGPTAMPNYQRGNADSYQQPVPMPVDTDPWANQIYQYADGGAALVGGSPAKMKMQPTQPVGSPWPPVGQPAQPHMQIPEPVIGVGQFTGIPHFRIGDNPNGPELMTIVPPEGVSPGRARMKVPA
jgi:hypothetical protein